MIRIFCISFFIFSTTSGSGHNLQDDIQRANNSYSDQITLSRKRRYLTFPEGSSLQLVYCLTVPSVGVGEIFTLGSTAALAWELPSTVEDILAFKGKTTTTTTTEPPATTLPPLIHEEYHDSHNFDDNKNRKTYGVSSKPWYYTVKNSMPAKSYYNPFINTKVHQYGYTPAYMKQQYMFPAQAKGALNEYHYRKKYDQQILPTDFTQSVHYNVHRRTRRDLYEKIEKLFTALRKDGRACLLKAICEVSKVENGKGTMMEEIIKEIFRIKPHEKYPEEDHYDMAANEHHNCKEMYPTCENSIWADMF